MGTSNKFLGKFWRVLHKKKGILGERIPLGAVGGSILLLVLDAQHDVGQNTQDQGAGDGGQGDLTEGDGQAADARNEDDGDHEQVAVLLQIYLLDHLQTRHGDEAVESHAHTAHDAGGNGVDEGYEGRQEGDGDGHEGGHGDGDDGCVTRDGHATHRLAVGGVGATAEDGARHGAYAVTQQGVVETGILQKILFNDGGQVLMVGQMLGKDHGGHGNIGHEEGEDVLAVDVLDTLDGLHEGEVGNRDDGLDAEVGEEIDDGIEIDNQQGGDVGDLTDDGEDGGHGVACQNTDDEGDEADHLLAEGGAEHGDGQGDETADDGHVDGTACGGGLEVADGVTCQGQTDDGDGGADDGGGHELGDPLDAHQFNDQGDQHVDETGHGGADDETHITGLGGCGTREGGAHGADEGEGGAQEHGALEAGEELVDQRADTRAQQSGGGAHLRGEGGHRAAGVDDDGHHQGGGHDGQELLDGEDDDLTGLRSVLDAVDEFHACVVLRVSSYYNVAATRLGTFVSGKKTARLRVGGRHGDARKQGSIRFLTTSPNASAVP